MGRVVVFTSNFGTLADGNLSSVDSADWLDLDGVNGAVTVTSHTVLSGHSAISACRQKGTYDLTVGQYAEATVSIGASANNDIMGVGVLNTTATETSRTGYDLVLRDDSGATTSYEIRRMNAATGALFSSGTLLATGTVTRLSTGNKFSVEAYPNLPAPGNCRLKFFVGTTLIVTFDDTGGSALLTGSPTIEAAQGGGTCAITNIETGNISAAAAPSTIAWTKA